ncbi:hypothetical protein ZWY2020_009337 [Hordeum vulgare]|nr:hypothetical protein ZWY2020_009337 [Hordeum vulgare]
MCSSGVRARGGAVPICQHRPPLLPSSADPRPPEPHLSPPCRSICTMATLPHARPVSAATPAAAVATFGIGVGSTTRAPQAAFRCRRARRGCPCLPEGRPYRRRPVLSIWTLLGFLGPF